MKCYFIFLLFAIYSSLHTSNAPSFHPFNKDYIRVSQTKVEGPYTSLFSHPVVAQTERLLQAELLSARVINEIWQYIEPGLQTITTKKEQRVTWTPETQYAKHRLIRKLLERCDKLITSGKHPIATYQPTEAHSERQDWNPTESVPLTTHTNHTDDSPGIITWNNKALQLKHQQEKELQSLKLKPFAQLGEKYQYFAKLYRYLIRTEDLDTRIPSSFEWKDYLNSTVFDQWFESRSSLPALEEEETTDIYKDIHTLWYVTFNLAETIDHLEQN